MPPRRRHKRRVTLRSIARRLRSFFAAAIEQAESHVISYLQALRDADFEVPEEGPIPWELIAGTLSIGYADSVTNETGFAEVPFHAFIYKLEASDKDRQNAAAEAALDMLREWFAEEGKARFVLSASWRAAMEDAYLEPVPDWRDDGTLIESGDSEMSRTLIGVKPLAGTAWRAVRGGPPRSRGGTWRITRRSTARGERVRSRNKPGTKSWGGELEDFT